jgi:hypothetical protein
MKIPRARLRRRRGAAYGNCHTPRMRVSSTPRPVDSIISISGILDHPHARVMTIESVARSLETVIASTAKQSMARHNGYGLLRRFRLRSLSYGGQVAPRNDDKTQLRDPAARCARVVLESSAREGVGNAGRPMHPQPRVRSVESTRVSHHRSTRITRHSRTRMVLTVYSVLSPVSEFVLSPSSAD